MANRPAGQNFIQETDGNPNGVVTGALNDKLRDWNTDLVYICTSNPTGNVWALHTVQSVNSPLTQQALPAGGAYQTILTVAASHIAGRVAGVYGLGFGAPAPITGVGTLAPWGIIRLVAADYPIVAGSPVLPKLRIRAQLYTNDVAPTGNFTFALHPVTRPATSGAAGLNIYTIGAALANSGVLFTTPAADLLGTSESIDFPLPIGTGAYIIAVTTTATVAVSSLVHLHAQLQIRNV